MTANAAGLAVGSDSTAGATSVHVANPFGMSSRVGVAASLQISGDAGLTYSAEGLPPGLSVSPSGLISGVGSTHGTATVTVTGTNSSGAKANVTFVWTVS